MHKETPITVGRRKASAVHFMLPVSLRIVKQVVEHGQWNSENTAMQMAVFMVQPWAVKRANRAFWSAMSVSAPV